MVAFADTPVRARVCTPENAYPRFRDAILSTKYFDDETELAYYGYRYYSPEMGRFISRDPIGERSKKSLAWKISEASKTRLLTDEELLKLLGIHRAEEDIFRFSILNLQLFCFNNPVNDYDAHGECPQLIQAVMAALYIGGVILVVYVIDMIRERMQDSPDLSREYADCMLDAAAVAIGGGVGGGGGPVSGEIVEGAMNRALDECLPECEEPECSQLEEIDWEELLGPPYRY